MSESSRPAALGDCVCALAEILENLIEIQSQCTAQEVLSHQCSCNNTAEDSSQILPNNSVPEPSQDKNQCNHQEQPEVTQSLELQAQHSSCQEDFKYEPAKMKCPNNNNNNNNTENQSIKLPPARSRNETRDRCREHEDYDNCTQTSLNTTTTETNSDCKNNMPSTPSMTDSNSKFQRIVAIRENCDGSISKIYALRKKVKLSTNSNCSYNNSNHGNSTNCDETSAIEDWAVSNRSVDYITELNENSENLHTEEQCQCSHTPPDLQSGCCSQPHSSMPNQTSSTSRCPTPGFQSDPIKCPTSCPSMYPTAPEPPCQSAGSASSAPECKTPCPNSCSGSYPPKSQTANQKPSTPRCPTPSTPKCPIPTSKSSLTLNSAFSPPKCPMLDPPQSPTPCPPKYPTPCPVQRPTPCPPSSPPKCPMDTTTSSSTLNHTPCPLRCATPCPSKSPMTSLPPCPTPSPAKCPVPTSTSTSTSTSTLNSATFPQKCPTQSPPKCPTPCPTKCPTPSPAACPPRCPTPCSSPSSIPSSSRQPNPCPTPYCSPCSSMSVAPFEECPSQSTSVEPPACTCISNEETHTSQQASKNCADKLSVRFPAACRPPEDDFMPMFCSTQYPEKDTSEKQSILPTKQQNCESPPSPTNFCCPKSNSFGNTSSRTKLNSKCFKDNIQDKTNRTDCENSFEFSPPSLPKTRCLMPINFDSSQRSSGQRESKRKDALEELNSLVSQQRSSVAPRCRSEAENCSQAGLGCRCGSDFAQKPLRVQCKLCERDANALLNCMIDTIIDGFEKVSVSLSDGCKALSSPLDFGQHSDQASIIRQLTMKIIKSERKINDLRMNIHEILCDMSAILCRGARIQVPEIEEMVQQINSDITESNHALPSSDS